jgi:hypothetical protein
MSITIVGGGNPSGPTFPVQRSVRFRDSASAYFNRTPASAGSRTTWTWSGWIKRGAFYTTNSGPTIFSAGINGNDFTDFRFLSNTSDVLDFYYNVSASTVANVRTTQVFRDPSAWYHIVLAFDTTQATAANRVKMYVNGVQVTAFSTATYPAQNNAQCQVNATNAHYIGRSAESTYRYFDGYMTEVNFIDGQALTPTSFGAYNSYGVWSPAKYSGTYGTNGFYLNFQDNSAATAAAIGKDSSGNGNNWTPNNISVTAGATYDSMLDVPTLTSPTNANFCTLNPLAMFATGASASNGNLKLTVTTAGGNLRPTFGATRGKYYAEFTITNIGGNSGTNFSIQTASPSVYGNSLFQAIYYVNGQTYNYSTSSFAAYGASYTTGDVIGVAWDIDNTQVTFYKNNVSQGTLSGAAITHPNGTEPVSALAATSGGTSSTIVDVNFGQQPFTYTPPTGFQRLNTYNLPAPTIPNGAAQMAATLWTGTGVTRNIDNTVNGVSFQPDLVWLKIRSSADSNGLFDSVRGASKRLQSNDTGAEATTTAVQSAFLSNGFTVGTDVQSNGSGSTYVGWQWKANGTPAVVNTSGSIPSTISANTTAGFSIVTYTGTGANATVGHGLGIAPKMVIVKSRSVVQNWGVYHASIGNTGAVFLNLTNATDTNIGYWNNTTPTSTVFSIGTGGTPNTSGGTYVAYCFSEIAGYSKFGSYTGNGSADGPFIYTGFRPKFVLTKSSTALESWYINDSSINPYNVTTSILAANTNAAQATGSWIDILSNGFKIRYNASPFNTSGGTYIYAAFAENPFNYSLAR